MERYQQLLDESDAVDADNYEINIRRQLKLAELENKADLELEKLSGGELKLVQVIRQMLRLPGLLIMDEPDVFLDFENLNGLRDLINAYKGTLLVVTHSRYLLAHCFDRIWHLENGDLQEFAGNFTQYSYSRLQKKIDLQLASIADEEEIQRISKLVDDLRELATEVSESQHGRTLKGKVSYLNRLLSRQIKAPFVEIRQPEIILLSATLQDTQVASRVAARLEAGLSADCTDLWMENGLLVMHRPAFGGGVEADILCPNAKPQMATVRPGVFSHLTPVVGNPVLEEGSLPDLGEDPIRLLAETVAELSENITDAKVVVAGGLGVGSKENFQILKKLADLLGGQVGASRAAVDAGFVSWTQQIGQTGKTVHPKLYLAFGISGSIQHIMGMNASDFVISVNSDPKAPIFEYSDVAITADWKETAEELIRFLEK